jgi:phosphatidate cytidylyltransferase
MTRNLVLRWLVSLVFIPLLVYIFYRGGLPFLILTEVLIAFCLWEFLVLTGAAGSLPHRIGLMLIGLYPPLAWQYLDQPFLLEYLLLVLFMAALPHTFRRSLGDVSKAIAAPVFGVVYISLSLSCLILIRAGQPAEIQASAAEWIVFLFATVWIVDTVALYAGKSLGQTKLSPVVSPRKTVVGFVAGVAGGPLSAAITTLLVFRHLSFVELLLPSLLIAITGQLGDLVESIFKREIDCKDSSGLIPGHGGALDRFDSILFAAPALYLYLRALALI